MQPKLIVALGATALYSLFGNAVKVTAQRGHILQPANHPPVLVTIHPSYLLRIRDKTDAAKARKDFVNDLKQAIAFKPA
jgi:DNA polymerase